MATSFADFAEQTNPKTLAEARRAGFRQATRVHGSFLAAAEKRALVWMAERMPVWVNSDHLTLPRLCRPDRDWRLLRPWLPMTAACCLRPLCVSR